MKSEDLAYIATGIKPKWHDETDDFLNTAFENMMIVHISKALKILENHRNHDKNIQEVVQILESMLEDIKYG